MAINVYNTKQQALNAEKLAELFSFSTNDFGGLISNIENPIVFLDGRQWKWATELGSVARFVGGGIDIEYDIPSDPYQFNNNIIGTEKKNYIYGLEINIPDSNLSILSNSSQLATIKQITCSDILINNIYRVVDNPTGSPKDLGYYEKVNDEYILSEDTSVFNEILDPESNPSENGYYEKVDNEYILSEDTELGYVYTEVADPQDNPSENDYYEYIEGEYIPSEDTSLFSLIVDPGQDANPYESGWYEYDSEEDEYILSEDTELQDGKDYYQLNGKTYYTQDSKKYYELNGKTYYCSVEKSFTFTNIPAEYFSTMQPITLEYYGNTCWINHLSDNSVKKFFIPFCAIDSNDDTISIIFNRDKAGYESFLTARTYYRLLEQLQDIFVFRSGGETKGDIGQLNITDNNIINRGNSTVNIDKLSLTGLSKISNRPLDNILVTSNGTVSLSNDSYFIPISHGGTSADNEGDARKNLGFNYGTDTPSNIPKRSNGETDIGAIYFKIL